MDYSAEFRSWFSKVTGHPSPRDWQTYIGKETSCRNRVIRIPTGLGKTEGVLTAWAFHRIQRADETWPRRLVWCLPMRVLVDQTEHVARTLMARMQREQHPHIHVLMGGEDTGEWFLHPEQTTVIIGTQDMLLSRALNRGYSSARARWPVEFGLLNHDCLWIMDEVQLMDVGLATSAQLQAFRDEDSKKGVRPCYTWWMSATLQPQWLRTVDTAEYHPDWVRDPCSVPPALRNGGVWDVRKALTLETIAGTNPHAFAQKILEKHAAMPSGEYGHITLVVCNTVDRACDTFAALQAAGRKDGLELVHSRFRPAERDDWRERFLCREACMSGVDRIIVATQVVEAGVDISADCVITELAPWPSLVQRFGRCARYGGSGQVIVVDRGRDERTASPYSPGELTSAWESLQGIGDVGIANLESHEEALDAASREKLYPYEPSHLLLRREFDELFDTTPDLTGADLDISRFIRSGDERDVQVFWLDLEPTERPSKNRRPQRQELCAVPFLKARNWLCGEETKTNHKPRLRKGMRAWVWDWIDGEWVDATRASITPGRIVSVAAACGGYRMDLGFDPGVTGKVPTIPISEKSRELQALDESDNQQDAESLSVSQWKTIGCHGSEVADAVRDIAESIGLPAELRDILVLAGIWHDLGKAHPAFQGSMVGTDRPSRQDMAKAPEGAWLRPPGTYRFPNGGENRPAFRHELASALALFAILENYAPEHPALLGRWSEAFAVIGVQATPNRADSLPPQSVQRILDCSAEMFGLLVYLVASHHGKVRTALHAAPKDQEYRDRDGRGLPIRGVREGDRLPEVMIDSHSLPVPALSLTLEPAALGLSTRTGASWRERCLQLFDRCGPVLLAYLEALLRAADVSASRMNTADPALLVEVSV